MSITTIAFGVVIALLVGGLLADVMMREPGRGTNRAGLMKIDERCPSCGNASLYRRHGQLVCEQCGVVD